MTDSPGNKLSGPLQQRYKSFSQLLFVVSTFALGTFYFGYAIAYFSSIEFDTLADVYNIDWSKSTAKGLLTGCLPIGGGIGALASDILIKRFSRRYYTLLNTANTSSSSTQSHSLPDSCYSFKTHTSYY